MLVNIKTDTYFITERLKEIDNGYFVVFNTNSEKFEIHHKDQGLNTFCLSLPYDCLDERVVDLVEKTQIEHIEKLIAEIDKENERKEAQKNKEIINKLKENLNES